jgi:predicted HicB family RNase H-like nuclease
MNKQTHKTKAMKTKQETPKGRNHQLALRVDLKTLNTIKAEAERQGVTVSTMANRVVQKGLQTV